MTALTLTPLSPASIGLTTSDERAYPAAPLLYPNHFYPGQTGLQGLSLSVASVGSLGLTARASGSFDVHYPSTTLYPSSVLYPSSAGLAPESVSSLSLTPKP